MAGALLSSTGYALAPYIESMKIPMVYPVVSADDLTQRRRGAWIVRTGWSGSQPNHAFGEYAYHTLGVRSVVTIALDYAFGWESVGGFERTFLAEGGRIRKKTLGSRLRARLRALPRANTQGRRCRLRAPARPVRAAVHEAIPGVRIEGSRDADRRWHDDRRARAAVHGRRGNRHGYGLTLQCRAEHSSEHGVRASLSRALQEGAELLLREHVHGRQVARGGHRRDRRASRGSRGAPRGPSERQTVRPAARSRGAR